MLTPNTTPQDAAGAFAILQVIADPKKAKAEFERLSKVALDAHQVMADAKKARDEAIEKEKALQGRESAVATKERDLAKREAKYQASHDAITHERAKLNADKDSFEALKVSSEQSLADERNAAQRLAADASAAEARAASTQAEAQALKDEYTAKLEKLRATVA